MLRYDPKAAFISIPELFTLNTKPLDAPGDAVIYSVEIDRESTALSTVRLLSTVRWF